MEVCVIGAGAAGLMAAVAAAKSGAAVTVLEAMDKPGKRSALPETAAVISQTAGSRMQHRIFRMLQRPQMAS